MSHALASALTSSLKNVAVIITATSTNQGMCSVLRAVDNVPIATAVQLEGKIELFFPSGRQVSCAGINACAAVIKTAERYPSNAPQKRAYSRIVNKDEFWDN